MHCAYPGIGHCIQAPSMFLPNLFSSRTTFTHKVHIHIWNLCLRISWNTVWEILVWREGTQPIKASDVYICVWNEPMSRHSIRTWRNSVFWVDAFFLSLCMSHSWVSTLHSFTTAATKQFTFVNIFDFFKA